MLMALGIALLLILITANGTPLLLRHYLGSTFTRPIDGGLLLTDGQPLFGHSKTWRGVFFGLAGSGIVAFIIDFSILFAILLAFLSLLGDLISSFIKRRLKLPPSTYCIGLDQLPEALLPLLVGRCWFDYGLDTIIIVTLCFFLVNVVLSWLGVSSSPH